MKENQDESEKKQRELEAKENIEDKVDEDDDDEVQDNIIPEVEVKQ
jgi:hypothetical protein